MISNKSIVLYVCGLVLLGGFIVWYFSATGSTTVSVAPVTTVDATKEQIDPTPSSATTGTTGSSSTHTSPYKDGTYSAIGLYRTPETTEQLAVTLTLKNGIVTDVSATGNPSVSESRRFQNAFLANYRSYVVGQPISSLSLSHVSGSSLTSNGFNNAVAQIRAQAQG